VIEPLKKLKDGEPCKRPPKIESKLLELDGLSNAELIRRSEIVSPTDPGFIPAECLVYVVRSRRGCDPSDSTFEQLYTALFKRVLAQLPREPEQDGRGEAGLESEVRSIAASKFAELARNQGLSPSFCHGRYLGNRSGPKPTRRDPPQLLPVRFGFRRCPRPRDGQTRLDDRRCGHP